MGKPMKLTVGFDCGYGVTKLIAPDCDPVVFPSVAGIAKAVTWQADDLTAKYPGDLITDVDDSWIVGDRALKHVPDGQLLRLRGRTGDELSQGHAFRVRMFKAAMGKLLAGKTDGDIVHVAIATGLPVKHMGSAPALKQALIRQHLIRSDSAEFVVNVASVMVMPQPYGTIYRLRFTEQGEINPTFTAQKVGVIDVGTYTIDSALDDEGEYIEARSGGIDDAGVTTAQDAIRASVDRDFGFTPDLRTIESVLRDQCIVIDGKNIDYTEQVSKALKPLKAAAMSLLGRTFGPGRDIHAIPVSGGGAALVIDDVQAAYSHAEQVEDSQLANAQGYLNYALFQANE